MLSSLSIVPSLLQETVETGPPVEVQVRVNTGESASSNWKVISSGIVTWPFGGKDNGIKKRAIIKAKTRKSKQNKTNNKKRKQINRIVNCFGFHHFFQLHHYC